ncbi:MAG TPA: exosortase/archaeosortase family protein [Planctomycetota bacterium]|nr:exosortase/archaeosortase family protein [Planctomycetota bacterium]
MRPETNSPAPAPQALSPDFLLREWAILLALLCAAFLPVLRWMYDRWTAPDSYTSHGFLVPLVCGWLVYTQREQLLALPRKPAISGLFLFAASLLLLVVSGLLRVYFTSGFALVGCIAGMIAYWGGWRWVARLWFPLLFLIFMLPLPEIAIARINLFLKLMVTQAAVACCELIGIPVVMDGAKLQLQNGDLVVGDVCSGLRSLTALIALGTLFAWLYPKPNKLVRGALLAAIVPVALGANMVRIFLNVLFVHLFGKELLFRPLYDSSFTGVVDLHLLSGFLVFVIALLGLHFTVVATEALSEPETASPQPGARESMLLPDSVIAKDIGTV